MGACSCRVYGKIDDKVVKAWWRGMSRCMYHSSSGVRWKVRGNLLCKHYTVCGTRDLALYCSSLQPAQVYTARMYKIVHSPNRNV